MRKAFYASLALIALAVASLAAAPANAAGPVMQKPETAVESSIQHAGWRHHRHHRRLYLGYGWGYPRYYGYSRFYGYPRHRYYDDYTYYRPRHHYYRSRHHRHNRHHDDDDD